MKDSLDKHIFQKQTDIFAKKYNNKKIMVYGAGSFSKDIFEACDLSALNIIGVADLKYTNNSLEDFFGIKTFSPENFALQSFDVLLLFVCNTFHILQFFKQNGLYSQFIKNKIKIDYFKTSPILKNSNENCIICNHSPVKYQNAQIAEFLQDLMFNHKYKSTQFIHCPDCKISYFKLRPDSEESKRYYTDYASDKFFNLRKKYEQYLDIKKNNGGWNNEYRKKQLNRYLIKHLEAININGKVLDYGGFCSILPDCFDTAEKHAFDLSDSENKNSNIKIIRKITPEYKNYFDFILSTHMLEHVSYPKEEIQKMFYMLKPRGFLYLEVPDESGSVNDIKINSPRIMHEHINIFHPKTFEFLLKDLDMNIKFCRSSICSKMPYKGVVICLAQKN